MENTIKLIGVVDWFHDKIRDAKYGFVKHPIIGQHYFNDRSVAQLSDLNRFKTDTIVTFYSRESKHKKGSFEAYDVFLLENETDIQFFISEYLNTFLIKGGVELEKIKSELKKKILSYFNGLEPENFAQELLALDHSINTHLIGKNITLESKGITDLVSFIHTIDETLAIKIEKDILEKADNGTVFNLWMDGRVSYCNADYINEIFSSLDFNAKDKVLSKLELEECKKVLLHQIYLPKTDLNNIVSIVKLVNKCDEKDCLDLIVVLLQENEWFFKKDFWISELGINDIVLAHSERSEQVRNAILKCNIHFLQKELTDEFFCDFHEIVKLFEFTQLNLSENLPILKEILTRRVSTEIAHQLWLSEILNICQIDYVSNILDKMEDKDKELVFSKCSLEDKTNILYKSILNLDLKSNNFQYSSVKDILSTTYSYAPEIKNKILTEIIKNIPEYYQLNLWIDDFHEDLNYNLYKPYVITLSTNEQRIFVKKVLKYIHEGRISLKLEDLTSLNVMDYETSVAVRQVDGSKLDFSTSIILNTLKELKENNTFNEKTIKSRILEIIISQIQNPEDILEIKGFFDKCAGRCNAVKNEEKNENGDSILAVSYSRSSFDFPRMHIYCDGRKSLKKDNLTPNLDEITKKEFWWCGNKPCHEVSRQRHSADEWEKYSLMDFLHIFKINYKEIDLELYINVINKLNRFLSHMSCRSCNHILRPVGKSNYAFGGVSNFHCTNEKCDDNQSIYISHCLNGSCGETIDSRDSVRCSPEGYNSEQCGWYICQNCHSCCSNSAIERRSENLVKNGRNYVCHTEGHKELGVMFCNQCGSEMNNSVGDIVKRNEVIDFFKNASSNAQIVAGSGQRQKDGGWWFRFAKGQLSEEQYAKKLHNLAVYGFSIPKIDDKSLLIQLISEPFLDEKEDKLIICSNSKCGKSINLKDNFERTRAIKVFHSKIFPTT